MGRYLDLAAEVIVGLDTGSQCEKSEISEISHPAQSLHTSLGRPPVLSWTGSTR